ncbi:MAG: SDR family NAD(P)-dependent oxidoreductase [Rhodopseudomonas palustris]|nr:SDR family NAD(P)-dependent oxidoreductase [Rhodopseudomonas palustris]
MLITGGGSGLGAATARAMAAKGAKVAVFDMNKDNAEKVAAEIGGVACVGDVSDEASVKAAIDKAEAAHGVVRVLVNCAGIGSAVKTVSKNGAHSLRSVRACRQGQPDRHLQRASVWSPTRMAEPRRPPASERGVIVNTAIGRGLRRPDRPGGLFARPRAASSA